MCRHGRRPNSPDPHADLLAWWLRDLGFAESELRDSPRRRALHQRRRRRTSYLSLNDQPTSSPFTNRIRTTTITTTCAGCDPTAYTLVRGRGRERDQDGVCSHIVRAFTPLTWPHMGQKTAGRISNTVVYLIRSHLTPKAP